MHKRPQARSFNGAATLSLRKPTSRCSAAAVTTCFNGAATLSLRKLDQIVSAHLETITLQWGRNFIVAETGRLDLRGDQPDQASMGPQLYRCGNSGHTASGPTSRRSFNGAATLSLRKLTSFLIGSYGLVVLQWGRNFIVAETTQRPCWLRNRTRFNGAATLSLRKPAPVPDALPVLGTLQWDRNFIVAETLGRVPHPHHDHYASMGPQLYRCGNQADDMDGIPHGIGASMGPQLYRCGNLYTSGEIGTMDVGLQWGRNFIVAETRRGYHAVKHGKLASMGPQLYRCGNPTSLS